ncbi:MAG TPA: hypothetical protein VLI94_05640 [Solirubrobacterales bacterium]|nr:hypothetical protein [Solirubrobacterales bacterium]
MRTPRLLLLIAVAVFAQSAFLASSLAAPQVPDVDVDLPPLPKADETAKFKMTVHGQQGVSVAFKFEVPSPDCTLVHKGEVTENWHYERGKKVVIEFRRYGDNVFISRQGRQIGDLAFGTTGYLVRTASGSTEDCRGTFILNQSPDCGKKFNASRDFRLSYQNDTIAVEAAVGKGGIPRNPAEQCGNDTDVLSPEYPTFIKAKAGLSAKRIFNAKKGIELKLRGRAIKPLAPAYTTIDHYSGESILELTLTRITPKK